MRIIKYSLVAFVMIVCSVNCFAQQNSVNKFQFYSINNIGLIEGKSGSALQLQTINGVQFHSWFLGIGVGLDKNRFRTIPLFIDLRKDLSKTKNGFFIYADAGTNYQDEVASQKTTFNLYPSYNKFNKGFYFDAGAGYKIKLKKNSALLFSAGYTYKELSEQSTIYYGQPGFDYLVTPIFLEHHNYYLNSLTLKVGWDLNL
jgi:hypothetical protein